MKLLKYEIAAQLVLDQNGYCTTQLTFCRSVNVGGCGSETVREKSERTIGQNDTLRILMFNKQFG